MKNQFLSDKDLAARYGVSRQTIWRWHRTCVGFPRAIQLSEGCTRWKQSEIESWEAAVSKEAAQ